jgi:hypothetical protein
MYFIASHKIPLSSSMIHDTHLSLFPLKFNQVLFSVGVLCEMKVSAQHEDKGCTAIQEPVNAETLKFL